MSRFEYLSVLVSIVIAIGVSEIAGSWGRLLRARSLVRFDWLHAFWSAFAVVLMIQFWWGFWEFRVIEAWSFPGLLAVVAECLVLVVAAMVLVPSGEITSRLDLRHHYFQQARPFFSLGALLLVQLTLTDHIVGRQPFLHQENIFRLLGLFVAGVAAISQRERIHSAIAVAASLLLLGFASFSFTR